MAGKNFRPFMLIITLYIMAVIVAAAAVFAAAAGPDDSLHLQPVPIKLSISP